MNQEFFHYFFDDDWQVYQSRYTDDGETQNNWVATVDTEAVAQMLVTNLNRRQITQHDGPQIPPEEAVCDQALHVFWEKVAQAYPMAETGDLGPDMAVKFSQMALEAVRNWVGVNVTPHLPRSSMDVNVDV